jgi:hypothetical protein
MSAFPRYVLAGVTVNRDGGATYVKAGTVADIKPGSELEQAYGGSGNLSAVIPLGSPSRSPEARRPPRGSAGKRRRTSAGTDRHRRRRPVSPKPGWALNAGQRVWR